MSNILVTGGLGFIGSNFIRYLIKNDDYVVSLSVLADDEREFILAVTENGFGKRSSCGGI